MEGSQLNKAKEILAFQLTELVHGTEEAKKAEAGAKALLQAEQIQSICRLLSLLQRILTKKAILT